MTSPVGKAASTSPHVSCTSEETLHAVAAQLKSSDLIQDRTYRLRKYKQCFVGSEAVDWMIELGHAADRPSAVLLGQAMMNAGLFHHVVWEHVFQDRPLFYRFLAKSPEGGSPTQAAAICSTASAKIGLNLSHASSDGLLMSPSQSPSPRGKGLPEQSSIKRNLSLRNLFAQPQGKVVDVPGHAEPAYERASNQSTSTLIPYLPEKVSASKHVFGTQLVGMQTKISKLVCSVDELQATVERLSANVSAELALQGLVEMERSVETSNAALEAALKAQETQISKLQAQVTSLSKHLTLVAAVACISMLTLFLRLNNSMPGVATSVLTLAASVAWLQPWEVEDATSAFVLSWRRRGTPRTPPPLAPSYSASLASSRSKAAGQGQAEAGGASEAKPLDVDWVEPLHGERSSLRSTTESANSASLSVPSGADFNNWADGPIMLVPYRAVAPDLTVFGNDDVEAPPSNPLNDTPLQRLRCNTEVPIFFESDLFKGVAFVYFRDIVSTPPGLFDKFKRFSWIAVQGKFKVPLSVDTVVTGQEFFRPFVGLPARWIVDKVFLSLAARINPSMVVGPLSAPTFMMPMVSTAQLMNVAREGEARPPMQCEEDVRLLFPHLVYENGEPVDAKRRCRLLSRKKDRQGFSFNTSHVYTFHLWQDVIDISQMSLAFAGQRISMVKYLAGQALQVMAKDVESGKYLYNFQIWHEALLKNKTR